LFLVEPNLRNHLVNLRNQTQKAILQKSSNQFSSFHSFCTAVENSASWLIF